MTYLYIAYAAAFFVPLLYHSWRAALLGLGIQGLLLALIQARTHEGWHWQLVVEFLSLLLIRGVFVPAYLFRRLRGVDIHGEFSVLNKNLISWLLAFIMLVAGYFFGVKMSPSDTREAMQIGTAAAAVLIGMLVLANQNHPVGQVVGLFTIEGGMTLVELLSPHAMPFPVSVGVSLVSVGLVLTCGRFLERLLVKLADGNEAENEVVL